jgi:streptomycin 6-kinase
VLSKEFAKRISAVYGRDGEGWLETLPSLLNETSQKWSLTLHRPFDNMAYHYVAPATSMDGREVVLKVGVPNKELLNEINALRSYNGTGAVNLLEADPELGTMLLERLVPGNAVIHLRDDEQATRVAIEVMAELHKAEAASPDFPTVGDWAEGFKRLRNNFDGGPGPFPSHLVELAEGIWQDLQPGMDAPLLLHGDLHHWNILSATREPWLAIDPQGVIGERAYEAGAWIRNPFPDILKWSNPKTMIARRIDQFALELGLDRSRIHGWGIYQAVLAGWWSYEEGNRLTEGGSNGGPIGSE